ncbi:MAG: PH domain-containing protein [Planctomycetaceae bacterium]|jgi:putative membrane protein|nr:PH domain-containing protein [Planctomycetaceae bacterium]
MEKEIPFDHKKVAAYFTARGLGPCAVFVLVFGIGIVMGIVYLAGIAWWLSPMQAGRRKYRLDDKTLRVDKGVVFLSRKAIPLDRITDIALVQGPVMRYIGIWALQIQTAGNGGVATPEAVLYGMFHPEQVREEILTARDAYLESRKSI